VNGYFAERLHQTTKVPYIITDHDFAEIADCERFPQRRSFFEPILRSAFRNVCVARRMEEDMKRIFPFARTQVIHNGINPHPASIFSTPRPAELEGKLVLFSAGMFVGRKGFPLLIEAFSKVGPRHPSAVLRIGGDGPDRGEIEATIARLGMADRVTLLGLLPQERIFQEMAWCDAFPLISWNEPFATVFIEAMGAGKPIVTASDGGINDVVQDRVHGMVVPPKDCSAAAEALGYLLENTDARAEMGRNAKRLVEEHLTWEANSRTMLDIFAQAARAKGTWAGSADAAV
jgi:glycosyltransferase involved in cell wall biosynthesis